MKCPKCKKDGAKYLVKRNIKPIRPKNETRQQKKRRRSQASAKKDKNPPRTDFRAKCNCGWKGEIY